MAVAFAVMLIGSAVLVTVGVMGLLGRLPRNHLAGVRTSYTLENDERWMAVHRAAAPLMIFGAVATASVSLAFFPFAVAGRVPDGVGGAVLLALAVLIVTVVIIAAVTGTRSAKARGL